jgi:A/G-specific adenine glycosylase
VTSARLASRPALQAAILEWGAAARRDLPWRRTQDPWAVLVSELMLAQTQVVRVVPKWETFLARWPDPPSCARAPLAAVITAWAGLGYNRRAVWLHRSAVIISERHDGRVPSDLTALMSLPGVGAYTARAVLAFSFEQAVGVVDTNAARVLARAVTGHSLSRAEAQLEADSLVPAGQAWAWNQAMLDLGAALCTSRRPACGECPLGAGPPHARLCRWARSERPDPSVGSAGTSRAQSPFAGSDRQGRGRLLARLTAASALPVDETACHQAIGHRVIEIGPDALAGAAGWPHDRQRAVVAAMSLVHDGLAEMAADGTLRLPNR